MKTKALLTKHFFELLNLQLRDPGDRNPLAEVVLCQTERRKKKNSEPQTTVNLQFDFCNLHCNYVS